MEKIEGMTLMEAMEVIHYLDFFSLRDGYRVTNALQNMGFTVKKEDYKEVLRQYCTYKLEKNKREQNA